MMKFILLVLYLVFIVVDSAKDKPPAHVHFFRQTLQPNIRVIGGVKAKRHEFPYQISLQINGNHICGGALISETHVVTAAHCQVRSNALYEVVAGMLKLYEDHEDIQRRTVKHFKIHPRFPRYSSKVATNDIAIIVLSEPFVLSPAVQLIELATKEQCEAMGNMTISGWGYANPVSDRPSSTLRSSILPRISYKRCQKDLIAIARTSKPLDSTMVCTSSMVGKQQSACSGDSGGPLVYDNALVGIISWGVEPCGTKNAPTVYIKLCSHSQFLRSDSWSCLILDHFKFSLNLSIYTTIIFLYVNSMNF